MSVTRFTYSNGERRDMNAPIDTAKVADNATLQVLSRLSMLATPFLIAGMSFFVHHWWQTTSTDIQELQVGQKAAQEVQVKANERITVLETNMERGRKDREEFQTYTRQQLDQIQAILRAFAETQARTNAILEAQQRQIDRRR